MQNETYKSFTELMKTARDNKALQQSLGDITDFIEIIDDTPNADVVSKKAYEQVKRERDTAIEQLNSYGVGFCEKADVVPVVRCKDCKHSSFIKSCSKYECQKGCGALKFSNDYCSYGERG